MRIQIRPENPETGELQGFVEVFIASDGSCFLSMGREQDDEDEVRTLQVYPFELHRFLSIAASALDPGGDEEDEEEEDEE